MKSGIVLFPGTNRERVRHEHESIVRAATDRDAAKLVALLTQHRQHAVKSLRNTIDAVS